MKTRSFLYTLQLLQDDVLKLKAIFYLLFNQGATDKVMKCKMK